VPKFQLVLLIHAHQPAGNFDQVFEHSYAHSYLPFLEVLARHPSVHAGLHYTGCLLEWIEQNHPEYFERLRELTARQQIELVGGGHYEPILISIPPQDRVEQIKRLADYIEQHFGARPGGAWLTERVWEPQLPSTLKSAGVEYTLVDDNHFLGAGFQARQLHGYYLCEDQGAVVKVLSGSKTLRYLIPFRDPLETTQHLRAASAEAPGGFVAMGDDLEKFGVWPGTYDHCYKGGWLDRFFTEIEANAGWLETAVPSEAIASRRPLGRADLPTASYTEMMEWSLPTSARLRYHKLTEEFSSRPDDLPFLRGGIWRNFFSKYSESNLLHKKMLHVSQKIRRLKSSRRRDAGFGSAIAHAETLLLQGQCNDAYWHGVFGGLYAPHLRTAVWRPLIEAEAAADRLSHRGKKFLETETLDFDADGRDEVYFTSPQYAAVLSPHDGATIAALDFRPSNTALINSLARRPEAYHAALLRHVEPQAGTQAVQSIHGQSHAKEEGLERWLNYDRWPRHAFRALLFGAGKTPQDYAAVHLEEDAALAAGTYRIVESSRDRIKLASEENADWPCEKVVSFFSHETSCEIRCEFTLRRTAPGTASVLLGMETVVNFLAPSAPDRYFESAGKRFPLRWSAAVPASELRVIDEWQRVALTLTAPAARDYWVAPIETVSESESGYERIYQGSQIAAVWPVELPQGGEWRGSLNLKIECLP